LSSIETRSLSKSFGDVRAVDDISFEIGESEIFGFLGPNGAGKSTTMMILTTLLKPTSGMALVAGYDVATQASKVRENIGYVQQETTVDEYLTGRENLLLQARLNHIDKRCVDGRIDEILDLIELSDKQHEAVITYSGGMRKRLDIAGGLLHRPRVLFLDEPTVGLDIQTRRKIWDYIRQIHKEHAMTIFLSTHYMEEADQLCGRVGIVDHGKIQAVDTPAAMKGALGQEIIQIAVDSEPDSVVPAIKNISDVKDVRIQDDRITVYAANGTEVIPRIFQISADAGIQVNSISLTQPTLDDVFVSYTGHELRDGGEFNRAKEHARMRRLRE